MSGSQHTSSLPLLLLLLLFHFWPERQRRPHSSLCCTLLWNRILHVRSSPWHVLNSPGMLSACAFMNSLCGPTPPPCRCCGAQLSRLLSPTLPLSSASSVAVRCSQPYLHPQLSTQKPPFNVLHHTMKLSSVASFLGAASLALTFVPSLARACEHECQVNVSQAFADKYQQLSSNYFTLLSQRVQDQIFHGIPVNTMGELDKNNAIKLINHAVTQAQNSWDVTLYPTVFHAIFKDKPPFKGDCNDPYRVQQPPPGVNWTMSDCHKMDYICGNPPSICHFMPMIKERIAKQLVAQLQARVGGVDSDMYINFLRPALDRLLMQQGMFSTFQLALRGNVNQVLESFQDVTDNFANEDQWPHDWDMEIQTLLLTFP